MCPVNICMGCGQTKSRSLEPISTWRCFSVSCTTSNQPLFFVPRQVKYAGLDAYAGILLARHVTDRYDPIVREDAPDSGDLPTGTTVRLYARTGRRCVAMGTVVDGPTGRRWGRGSSAPAVGKRRSTDRVVVKLDSVIVPGALALYPGQQGGDVQPLGALPENAEVLVLWDTVSRTLGLGADR